VKQAGHRGPLGLSIIMHHTIASTCGCSATSSNAQGAASWPFSCATCSNQHPPSTNNRSRCDRHVLLGAASVLGFFGKNMRSWPPWTLNHHASYHSIDMRLLSHVFQRTGGCIVVVFMCNMLRSAPTEHESPLTLWGRHVLLGAASVLGFFAEIMR